LKLSWKYNGLGVEEGEGEPNGVKSLPTPTCVTVCYSDLKKLVVGYSNAVVKLFDVETGKEVLKLKSDESYGA
jgi:striatin 1/3/4